MLEKEPTVALPILSSLKLFRSITHGLCKKLLERESDANGPSKFFPSKTMEESKGQSAKEAMNENTINCERFGLMESILSNKDFCQFEEVY